MIGRTAYENPYELATADQILYGSDQPVKSRERILLEYADYVDNVQNGGYIDGVGPSEENLEG